MSIHFITKCKICEVVIAQCRCPSMNKSVTYIICKKCSDPKSQKITTDQLINIIDNNMAGGGIVLCLNHPKTQAIKDRLIQLEKELEEAIVDAVDAEHAAKNFEKENETLRNRVADLEKEAAL